jgi:hypothetical protein
MAEHELAPGPPPDPALKYEPDRVNVRLIVGTGIGLAVLIALVLVGLYGLFVAFDAREEARRHPLPEWERAGRTGLPAEPRLEGLPPGKPAQDVSRWRPGSGLALIDEEEQFVRPRDKGEHLPGAQVRTEGRRQDNVVVLVGAEARLPTLGVLGGSFADVLRPCVPVTKAMKQLVSDNLLPARPGDTGAWQWDEDLRSPGESSSGRVPRGGPR